MPVAHCFPLNWKEANLHTYFIGCNFRHYTKKWRATEMIGGSTLEIYLQTSEPRLATLFFFCFFNQLFRVRQGCSMLNVGFEILLRLFPCAHLNICITISKVSYSNSLSADPDLCCFSES